MKGKTSFLESDALTAELPRTGGADNNILMQVLISRAGGSTKRWRETQSYHLCLFNCRLSSWASPSSATTAQQTRVVHQLTTLSLCWHYWFRWNISSFIVSLLDNFIKILPALPGTLRKPSSSKIRSVTWSTSPLLFYTEYQNRANTIQEALPALTTVTTFSSP